MTLIVGDCSLRQTHDQSCTRGGMRGDLRLEEDVLWFEIAVDDLGLLQYRQRVEKLSGEDADETRTESSERVLLDELIQVVGEELKDEAEMRVVDEGVLESQHVVLVVLVPLVVDLYATSLAEHSEEGQTELTNSRIVTSIILCWKYAGLFLTTLTATISCVLRF